MDPLLGKCLSVWIFSKLIESCLDLEQFESILGLSNMVSEIFSFQLVPGLKARTIHLLNYLSLFQLCTGDQRSLYMADLMRRDAIIVTRSMKPFLLSDGCKSCCILCLLLSLKSLLDFEDTLDQFIKGAEIELRDLTVHIYSVWHYAWALKKEEESA